MPVKKAAWVLLLASGVGAGFIPWNVTEPARWAGQRLVARKPGWQLTLARARWIPWTKLELRDLQVKSPAGGRFHFARVILRPRSCAFAGGRWISRWELGEIRMDSEPAADQGFAVLELDHSHWRLRELVLKGPTLNFSFGRQEMPS